MSSETLTNHHGKTLTSAMQSDQQSPYRQQWQRREALKAYWRTRPRAIRAWIERYEPAIVIGIGSLAVLGVTARGLNSHAKALQRKTQQEWVAYWELRRVTGKEVSVGIHHGRIISFTVNIKSEQVPTALPLAQRLGTAVVKVKYHGDYVEIYGQ